MDQSYGVAAYRSRQQVMKINDLLRRNGINASVVSTPREISAGCGLAIHTVLSELTFLQIKGFVTQEQGKRFTLNIIKSEEKH